PRHQPVRQAPMADYPRVGRAIRAAAQQCSATQATAPTQAALGNRFLPRHSLRPRGGGPMTPADRYAFEEATKHLAERWADEQAAIARAPRLSWGAWRMCPLETVPDGALFHHLADADEPAEVKEAITRELEIRLEDRLAWDRERRQQQ